MPLEHEPTHLTPEQRDRVLDLAARLQQQHEAGIRIDDLAQAAAEAGIDERFVRQAVRSVVGTPPAHPEPTRVIPAPDRNIACILLGVLTLFNVLMSLTLSRGFLNPVGTIWFGLLAAVTGFWSVKGRLPVWLVSAVLMMTLLITKTVEQLFHFNDYNDRLREIAMMFIMAQAVVALLVGGITRLVSVLRPNGTAASPH
ncbi:hypothetical protein EON82_01035 [bacterium]|nr:MAG: hypothetical protein EON82_01035 [bacterium]